MKRVLDSVLVRLEGVRKRYAALAPDAPDVLAGVDLELAQGESAAIIGPSGSGKSTLLHIIGTLAEPSAGRVLVCGADPAALDEGARARLRSREIGFVFQAHHLLPQCSALENALVPTLLEPDRAVRARAAERVRALLDTVGLGARLAHRPAQLSGGECQRVAVVRALANSPRLLLADEPTGSLDARSADALFDVLVLLREREGLSILAVTHSARLAQRLGRVLELADGRLVEATGVRA